jgi:uncharacterized iron-regulated membrane protein
MRSLLVRLHRWAGVALALFLFVSGLTGAIIAWHEPLDAWLNPRFYVAQSHEPPLPSIDIARRIEAADPRLVITYLPLAAQPGRTLRMRVQARRDPATQRPYPLGFNEIAVDPGTGAIQARREWGAPSLRRLNLLPFLYLFHYTLYLPVKGGIATGVWLLGIVAIVWLLDCMIALALAFPKRGAWRKSFAFRVRRGGYALLFDLHRSGGVWVWGLLCVIAFTSIAMNLGTPVVRPLVALFSPLTPPVGAAAVSPGSRDVPLSRTRILALARAAGQTLELDAPPGAIYTLPAQNLVAVGYFRPGDEAGSGLGNAWLYWDATTGRRLGASLPGNGSAGDVFLQAQFPLHSGRIAGVPGRIAVSAMGLVVAMLSATGLVIWLKKRNARRVAARRAQRAEPAEDPARRRVRE